MLEALRDRIDFVRPEWLVVGLVMLLVIAIISRHTLVDFSRGQRRLSLLTRTLIVVLLTGAAGGVTWYRSAVDRYVLLAVDRSASVDLAAQRHADKVIEQFRRRSAGHQLAVMEFAGRPGPVHEWSGQEREPLPLDSLSPDDRLDTNLAAAVEAARAAMPPGYIPHLVLITDGQPTHGDVLTSVAGSGLPISTMPLPDREQPEFQVSDMRAPAQVRLGEPFFVDVTLSGNRSTSGEIELFRDGLRVDLGESARVELQPGDNPFRLRQRLTAAQTATYTVRLRAVDDTRLDDNDASALVVVSGRPRVLVVDRDVTSVDALRWAWEEQQIDVNAVPPDGAPTALADLIGYDAIVLSDVPASAFSPEQLQWFREYVERWGGGMVMLGGEQSFGLGGYDKTPLADVLPVQSDLEQEREKPSLAMLLVIDRSGSMGGIKLDLAKEAARGTAELLGPRDQLGVIAFDDQAYWVSPLGTAADRLAAIDNIDRLSSAGGTNLYPALAEAYSALRGAAAKLKHVIVLSDGISAPADFERLVSEMVAGQIVVSTVALGDKADRKLLQQIAQQGAGRYYESTDPRSVPQIFAQETMLASQSAIDEEPFLPQAVRATAVLRGIDVANLPLLLGHVVTRAKPTSEVILTTEDGDPVLVWWRYGLGMVLAFTSDAKPRWATEWLTWPDYAPMWSQLLRHVMRNSPADDGRLSISRRGAMTRVALELVDRDDRFVNQAQVSLTLKRSGDGETLEQWIVPQTAPGRYEIEVAGSAQGMNLFDVIAQSEGQVRFRQTVGQYVGYPDELRLRPTDVALLKQIAAASGGLFDPTPEQVLRAQAVPPLRPVPLWRMLVSAALLLWLLDVALRRLVWSFV